MIDTINQLIKLREESIEKISKLIKLIEKNIVFNYLSKTLKMAVEAQIKMIEILKKLSDFIYQEASFADLDQDSRRFWKYKVKDRETTYDELLKSTRKISPDSYVYCDLHFYFSYTNKLMLVKALYFRNSQKHTIEKNYFDEEDILNEILN